MNSKMKKQILLFQEHLLKIWHFFASDLQYKQIYPKKPSKRKDLRAG